MGKVIVKPYFDYGVLAQQVVGRMLSRRLLIKDVAKEAGIQPSAMSMFLNAQTNLGSHNTFRVLNWLGEYDIREYLMNDGGEDNGNV
jgi:hypothetical protein